MKVVFSEQQTLAFALIPKIIDGEMNININKYNI